MDQYNNIKRIEEEEESESDHDNDQELEKYFFLQIRKQVVL